MTEAPLIGITGNIDMYDEQGTHRPGDAKLVSFTQSMN